MINHQRPHQNLILIVLHERGVIQLRIEIKEGEGTKQGSIAVTHHHWADVNTSKSCVEDVLVPYYRKVCAAKGLKEGEQLCILLVDFWLG